MYNRKRLFGIVGGSLEHSFSQKYFSEKFAKLGLDDCLYSLFPISEISQLGKIISDNPELEGLNVTSPYKVAVIPYLDELDADAQKLGAVNVIKIFRKDTGPYLKGYNTDVCGLRRTFRSLNLPSAINALILGTGGAAKAVKFVLEEMGINAINVSRSPKTVNEISYSQLTVQKMEEYILVVNATPVGIFPNVLDFPDIPYDGISERHICFDLIYNPEKTKYLKKCEEHGARIANGFEMLCEQADEAWKIWNDNK